MTEQELKEEFRGYLGRIPQVYLSSRSEGIYSVQIIKDGINLQFNFHIDYLNETKMMVSDIFHLCGKYGILQLAISFKPEDLI